jgi:tetratricopeptide (TPR) repeat protein
MDDAHEKRREPRFVLPTTTTVPASWGTHAPIECNASDISAHGIFLEMPAPPAMETPIVIGPPGALVKGRVVFSLPAEQAGAMGRKAGVGVQLDAPIDPDAFLLRCADRGVEVRAAAVVAKKEPVAVAEVPWNEVVVVDGVPAQAQIIEALAVDDYAPLVAKHALEGLALALRKLPRLVVVGADNARLPGAYLAEELTHHAQGSIAVVVVGAAELPQVPRLTAWPEPPKDVATARRLVDAAIASAITRPPKSASVDDPRALADVAATLARKLDGLAEHEAALSSARYAGELAPSVAAHTLLLARLLLASPDQRQRDEAASLVERVIRQEVSTADAYWLRAIVLDQRAKKEDAKAALRRCLVYAPGHAQATASLARLDAGQPLLQPRDASVNEAKRGFLGKLFKR